MTKQLNPNQLAEDYISAHLPFKGRSASQVLLDDTAFTSAKIWGMRSILKCRLRCVYSCLDLAHSLKNIGRSSKISDSTNETIVKQKIRSQSNRWLVWKRFFRSKENDVMSKKETTENQQGVKQRKNAAVFVQDYEEEQTINTIDDNEGNDSLELCDIEDSGHYDMQSEK